jgi:hypothetical protein
LVPSIISHSFHNTISFFLKSVWLEFSIYLTTVELTASTWARKETGGGSRAREEHLAALVNIRYLIRG